jgi:hypothetical protein
MVDPLAVDHRDVQVIELGEDLRFATEAGQPLWVIGNSGQQNLNRDVAI